MRYRISKYKHLHSNRFRYLSSSIPLVCASGLLVVLGLMINPIRSMTNNSYANSGDTDDPRGNVGGALTPGYASIELSDFPTLTEDQELLLQNKHADVGLNYITTNVNIKAINTSKYEIFVNSVNENNSLVGRSSKVQIPSITSSTKYMNLDDDTWGYALIEGEDKTVQDSIYFRPIGTGENTSKGAGGYSTSEEGEKFTLAFAVKFSDSAKPDHYQSSVVLSLVTEPGYIPIITQMNLGFDSITTMQQMTSSICNSAKENDTKQLIDTRDNKKYWVAKLKDGNCWMVQNLDLDIPVSGLKSSDTDTTSNWTTSSTYPVKATKPVLSYSWTGNDSDNTAIESVDLGEYVYNPKIVAPSECNTSIGLEACPRWTNVANLNASTDPNYIDGVTDTTYDSHYLIGNYYSWNAATAGSGGTRISTSSSPNNAPNSICPKGWQLPTSGSTNNVFWNNGKTFAQLFNSYGYTWENGHSMDPSGATGYYLYNAPFLFYV